MDTVSPAQLTKHFIETRNHIDLRGEREWLRAVFSAFIKVAKNKHTFIIDDVWEQIESMEQRGKMPKTTTDRRILGVIFRYLASEEVIHSSGYYTKSNRPGSRPVSVWTSSIFVPNRKVA